MRIIEPKQFHHQQSSSTRVSRKLLGFGSLAVVMLIGVASWMYLQNSDTQQAKINETSQSFNSISQDDTKVQGTQENQDTTNDIDSSRNILREFSDNEFKIFYDNVLLPNLVRVENPPSITGNAIADARIRKIAEARGYRLRSTPEEPLDSVSGQKVQEPVIASWNSLRKSAQNAGLQISIVSAYRSIEDQRALFLSRLSAAGATVEEVANGTADAAVDTVLKTSSIPGYSKHHTGYTLDLLCAGYAFENFKNSPCHSWISKNNYKVAKENGFIPSYPPLADAQGPDPEAWEYVWVGTDLLYE